MQVIKKNGVINTISKIHVYFVLVRLLSPQLLALILIVKLSHFTINVTLIGNTKTYL
jgi:hypothetical protein